MKAVLFVVWVLVVVFVALALREISARSGFDPIGKTADLFTRPSASDVTSPPAATGA